MRVFSASVPAGEFVSEMMTQLSGRELGKMVSLKLESPHSILVQFSKLGNSELRYALTPTAAGGFSAKLNSEKIAFAHKLFRGEMEAKLSKIMEKIGAKIG